MIDGLYQNRDHPRQISAQHIGIDLISDQGDILGRKPKLSADPAEGKAQVIVTRRLLSYPDIVRTDVKEVSFGGEG